MNNKKLLVILGEFFPYPSSNINCIVPLLEYLYKEGWQVDVVTRRHSITTPEYEKYHGMTVYRINDIRTMNTICWQEHMKIDLPIIFRWMNYCCMALSKIYFYLRYYQSIKDNRYSAWSKEEVLNKCLSLHELNVYNAVLSLSTPAITHYIASELKKHTSINWILYEMDPFCYNVAAYGKNAYKRFSLVQERFFKECDEIIVTPALGEFYQNTNFRSFSSKMIELPLANMIPIEDFKDMGLIKRKEKEVYCVFGGAIDPIIRNPIFAIDLFHSLHKNIKLFIITQSNIKFLRKKIDETADNVIIYGRESRNVTYGTMQQADILINIGNTVQFQVPGKIFEYMAMGKPIVHFSKIQEDPCLPYLKKYPIAYVIYEYKGGIETQKKNLLQFIYEKINVSYTYDEIISRMPELSGKSINRKFLDTVLNIRER
ncbi:hypothetical protein [Clostridium transplantifaecale]|uniref:hypothetical protein n=1 Tax=Clostridium transplantifaecale TaxID=2479838 RepID=UPI000F62D5C7|nr:hypothetical protein [Clostridium transplantifaecale]